MSDLRSERFEKLVLGLRGLISGLIKAQGVINIQKLSELAEADLDDIGISEPSDRRKLTYLLQKVRVAVRDVDAYVQENTPPKLKSVFDNISMEPSVLELSSPVASTSSEQTETECPYRRRVVLCPDARRSCACI